MHFGMPKSKNIKLKISLTPSSKTPLKDIQNIRFACNLTSKKEKGDSRDATFEEWCHLCNKDAYSDFRRNAFAKSQARLSCSKLAMHYIRKQ